VPEGWVWTTLGEISNYGDSDNVDVSNIDGNAWILELEDIEKNSANIYTKLLRKERNINGVRHKFNKGYILYSKLRTYLNKVLVAPSDGFCTTEIMSFYTFNVLSNEYLCNVLRSQYFLDYTLQCGYGVKMPRLSTTDACNGLIPLPPLREQLRIVAEIEKWFAFIDVIELSKDDLQNTIKQAKSKILVLAIHGKLVPQDPNDEPAMELLRRINPKAEITCDNAHYEQLPKGWAACKLEDIIEYEQPQAYIVSSADYNDSYSTPVLTAGKSFVIGYTQESFGTCDKLPVIIFDDFTTDSKYVDFPFKVKSSAMKILHARSMNVNLMYISYYMKITRLTGDTHKRYWISEYSKLEIMLPPKEEQNKIVERVVNIFSVLDRIAEGL